MAKKEIPSARSVGRILKVFWQTLSPHKGKLAVIWLAVLFAVGTSLMTPLFYRDFFDLLSTTTPKTDLAPQLIEIVFSILLLNLAGWIGWRAGSLMNNHTQPLAFAELRERSFRYLMGHSYGFFAGSFSGSLVQKVNRLVRAFEAILDALTWNILPMLMKLTVISIVIFRFNHTLGSMLFLWIVLFLGVNYAVSMWKMRYDTASASRESEMTGTLADAITNHTNVQVFAALPREVAHFRKVADSLRRAMRLAWNMEELLNALQGLLAVLGEFFLIYFAIRYWEKGAMTIGTFILLQSYLWQLIDQLWGFGRMMRHVYRSFADAEEMVTILNTPHEVEDTPEASRLQVASGRIEFRDVNFGFHSGQRVIDGLNLDIKAGEKVALIGPSGAGKSTVVKLLFRFYDMQTGQILIDGQDIKSVTQDSLRESIALVPQEPILFHRTLLENIRYGRPDATEEEVYRAAEMAHCAEFIHNLPDKYNTYVGERGIKLSGGERQRIAIARAILKNAPILVLDEATSSLDSHSEALIQEALEVLMRGKTVIVIAHRLSTIQKMDRIVVLENGKVREEGTHRDLMRSPESLYSHLWSLQAAGFLRDEEDAEAEEAKVREAYGEEE